MLRPEIHFFRELESNLLRSREGILVFFRGQAQGFRTISEDETAGYTKPTQKGACGGTCVPAALGDRLNEPSSGS